MDTDPPQPTRRTVLASLATAGVMLALPGHAENQQGGRAVGIAVFIRYQIDPFQRESFQKYAEGWRTVIPRCGGRWMGYFLPHEGTNDIAWGIIGVDSLAAYETYRAKLKADPEARANFAFAQSKRLVLREERTFLEIVG